MWKAPFGSKTVQKSIVKHFFYSLRAVFAHSFFRLQLKWVSGAGVFDNLFDQDLQASVSGQLSFLMGEDQDAAQAAISNLARIHHDMEFH